MTNPEPPVAAMWEKALPYITEALKHANGTHEPEDVLKGIAEGQLQLWLGENCAAVSEIMNFPRKRVLNMFLASGDLNELKAIQAGAEAFARGHACQTVQAGARPTAGQRRCGWQRTFDGFEPAWTQYVKELT